MSVNTPARDFILPRLRSLVEEAEELGIVRDVAVAVLIDLVTGDEFNTAPPLLEEAGPPRPPHNIALSEEEGSIQERTEHPVNPLQGEHVFRSDIRLGRRGYKL